VNCVKTDLLKLTIHKQSHTGAKSLKCYLCEKGFTESSSLTKHKCSNTGANVIFMKTDLLNLVV
jgi:hypothetical protein